MSKENDVNKRFIETICEFDYKGFVLRVCGDQVLLDCLTANELLSEMDVGEFDWFYEKEISPILPDIVSIDVIKKYSEWLSGFDRYFEGLDVLLDLKRKKLLYANIPFVARANSREGFRICKAIVDSGVGVGEYIKQFCHRMQNPSNYLSTSGLLGSWLLGCERDFFWNESGKVSAWWSESAVQFIKDRLKKDMRVFEYGCGNSTLFWMQYVEEIVSVENDPQWYERMRLLVSSKVTLIFRDLEYGGDYSKTIGQYGKFDIVLIDGRDRVNCVRNAVNSLTEDGVIVWDDSDRQQYQVGFDYLKKHGFLRIDFKGVCYGLVNLCQTTSIFYRRNNCFGI